MKLLWVEDEHRIVKEVLPFLQSEGCSVAHVSNAEEAKLMFETDVFDLVLID